MYRRKKKIGNSVERNYEKRVVREFFDEIKNEIKNTDMIVFVKSKNGNFFKKKEDFFSVIEKIKKNVFFK